MVGLSEIGFPVGSVNLFFTSNTPAVAFMFRCRGTASHKKC